jgi:hypothetical protein
MILLASILCTVLTDISILQPHSNELVVSRVLGLKRQFITGFKFETDDIYSCTGYIVCWSSPFMTTAVTRTHNVHSGQM